MPRGDHGEVMATYKGKYVVTNRQKYKGNANNVTYRSSWELAVMKWCDFHPQVKRFSSEEVVIPYFSQMDGKNRRYFMDFFIELENGITYLWEVKPHSQTMQPKAPSKTSPAAKARFAEAIYNWKVNTDKWHAANKYAKERGWVFKVMTERGLRKHGIMNG